MTYAIAIDAESNTKPWLVMVHGMSQDHRVFDRQVTAFRADYRILLVDLPGHGLASDVGGTLGHVEVSAHVRGALHSHGVEHPHYWGTHTGSAVGLYLAATEPGIFRSLVLEAPVVPGTNPPVATEVLGRAKAAAHREGLTAGLELWWREGPWFEHMRDHPEECRAAEHRAVVHDFKGRPWTEQWPAGEPIDDIESSIARIETPTLIANGVEDHADFLAVAKRLAVLLPPASQELIPRAGGFPAWENPDFTNAIVSEFLSSL